MKDLSFWVFVIGVILFLICSLATATGLTQKILDAVGKIGFAMFCVGLLAYLLK